MNHLVLALTVLAMFASGCDTGTSGTVRKLVPDGTVYIVSNLEVSPDATYHVPQVYVATIDDMWRPNTNDHYNLFADPGRTPGIELWHPMNWSQVGLRLKNFLLRPTAITDATVSITGPLAHGRERTVSFHSVGRGSYSDLNNELDVLSGETYRLNVTLGDGRRYTAQTRVPGIAQVTMPDTLVINTVIGPSSGPGHYLEEGGWRVQWQAPEGSPITTWVYNHRIEYDRELFGLQPGESFPYESRGGDFMRIAGLYKIFTHSFNQNTNQSIRQPGIWWAWDLYDRGEYIPERVCIRSHSLNDDLALFYGPEDFEYQNVPGEPWAQKMWDEAEVWSSRNAAYLPSISNIHRVGDDGQPLPKSESDAIGVFGAFSSRYLERIKIPRRTYDVNALAPPIGPPRPHVPPSRCQR